MRMISYLKDERGNVGIMFGLMLVPMVAFTGAAADYSQAMRSRALLQEAADAAVLAGASLPTGTSSDRSAAALKYFQANLASTALSNVSPTITIEDSSVTAAATFTQQTAFLGVIGYPTLNVSVRSSAERTVYSGGMACILALDPTINIGLGLVGVSKLDSNCWAWINSNSSSSIDATGTSAATAQGFCTAGQVIGGTHLTPAALSGCQPLADPFANLKAPSSAGNACTYTNTILKNGTYTLNPGVYCGGLTVRPQANVTFNPGVYIIKNGSFTLQAQSTATGQGVLFYFTGDSANLNITGGAAASFTAPTARILTSADSALAGFLFIQDRTSSPGATVTIQGGASVDLQGVLYMPTWNVGVTGNGSLNVNSNFWVMVANSFQLAGNGELYIKSDAASAGLPNPMPAIPNGVKLTQ